MRDPYWRRCLAEEVVDGDTLVLIFDLGFHLSIRARLRLAELDAPELNSPDAEARARAQAARNFTAAWVRDHIHSAHALAPRWPFNAWAKLLDKYGRPIGILECAQGHVLNDDLVAAGHAARKRY